MGFTQFPPVVTSFATVSCYPHQDADVEAVRMQNSHVTTRIQGYVM